MSAAVDTRALGLDWDSLSVEDCQWLYEHARWPVYRDGERLALRLGDGWCALVVDGTPSAQKAAKALLAAYGSQDVFAASPRLSIATLDGSYDAWILRASTDTRTAIHLHGIADGVHLWCGGRDLSLPPSQLGSFTVRWRKPPTSLTALLAAPDWLVGLSHSPHDARRSWERSSEVTPPAAALTDLGNAERLARRHGGDLRWVEAWGAWLVWNGTRWERDQTGEVMRRAADAIREIPEEAKRVDHDESRRKILKHALASESAGRISAAVTLLRSQPGIAVTVDALDADPWLLACPNGTVDMRTGELRPARREDLCTKLAGVAYDPAARAPTWEAFLAEVQPDAEVRAFLQRLAGYGATGVIREHVLPIHHGAGGNGKGVASELLLACLGEYARQVPTELLLSRQGEAHPTERASLWGCRLATASELPKGRSLNEALVKALTGGDTISARFMGRDFFEFRPTHTLWVSTNYRPVVREGGAGIWRRVLLVPWVVTPVRPDTTLPSRLRGELAGILRWIVEGCLDWQRIGLAPPDAVLAATEEYRGESDILGQFILERTTTAPEYPDATVREGAATLYKAYQAWCEACGQRYETMTAFGRALTERGFPADKRGGVVFRLGLRLLGDSDQQEGRQDG